ncbi:MAG: ComEC/Rec2 family competence protein [Chloroflexota bacterium]
MGYRLSVEFAATLGLMLYADPWTRWLQQRLSGVFAPDANRTVTGLLGEGLVVTAAAQVFALPLILYYFGQLSWIACRPICWSSRPSRR